MPKGKKPKTNPTMPFPSEADALHRQDNCGIMAQTPQARPQGRARNFISLPCIPHRHNCADRSFLCEHCP
jgi:hypothetical protein